MSRTRAIISRFLVVVVALVGLAVAARRWSLGALDGDLPARMDGSPLVGQGAFHSRAPPRAVGAGGAGLPGTHRTPGPSSRARTSGLAAMHWHPRPRTGADDGGGGKVEEWGREWMFKNRVGSGCSGFVYAGSRMRGRVRWQSGEACRTNGARWRWAMVRRRFLLVSRGVRALAPAACGLCRDRDGSTTRCLRAPTPLKPCPAVAAHGGASDRAAHGGPRGPARARAQPRPRHGPGPDRPGARRPLQRARRAESADHRAT